MSEHEHEDMPPADAGRNLPGTVDRAPFPTAEEVKKWDPKRLTPKHRQILSLHAQGMRRAEIGALCKCTPEFVSMLASTDSGKAYLKELEGYLDGRMRALYKKTIDAVEDQLENGRGADKLAAAKLQLQVTGKLGKEKDEAESAEDVIQRIMNLQVNGNIIIQSGKE